MEVSVLNLRRVERDAWSRGNKIDYEAEYQTTI